MHLLVSGSHRVNTSDIMFKYSFNEKRAKINLFIGAMMNNHLETEFKSGCINLGLVIAYHEVVLTLFRL